MNTSETGGPAFPLVAEAHEYVISTGMTLRDYFAAKAMQSLISSCDVSKQGYSTELDRRAVQAYLTADAMLKARSQS
jgi:hypothetical protein